MPRRKRLKNSNTERAYKIVLTGSVVGFCLILFGTTTKLWLTWRAIGNQGWADKIENYMSLAAYLTNRVKEEPTLELVLEPEFTNVCVRYVGHNLPPESQDDITDQIRNEMFERGKFMVTKALIDHRPILRPVIANPSVDQKSLDNFISEITTIGARMSAMFSRK